MFDRFLKECKTAVKSITYLIFCVVLIGMFFMQYRVDVNRDLIQAQKGILFEETRWGGTQNYLLVEPRADMDRYGSVDSEVPDQVKQYLGYRLYRDIASNRYEVYRLGVFMTHPGLKFVKQYEARDIFDKITGDSFYRIDAAFYKMDMEKILAEYPDATDEQADEYLKEYYKQLKYEFDADYTTTRFYNYEEYIPVNQDISYEDFKKEIAKLRKIIGGQSDVYMDFAQYGSVPLAFEEALENYETFRYNDRISGAYARLFCDDMGVVAGLLPVAVAWAAAIGGVLMRTREKSKSLQQGIGAENIWIRFLALSAVIFLPILVLALFATVELATGVAPLGLSIDIFAFFSYSIVWLLPTVMFAVAVGLFFTILTKSPVGIYMQLAIWYWSVLLWTDNGLVPIKYGANMFLRHGVVGEYDTYAASMNVVLLNRIAYTIAALALIAAAKYIGEKKNGNSI